MHTYPDRHHFATRTITFQDDYAPTLPEDKRAKWLYRRAKVFKKYGLAGLVFFEGNPQLHIMRSDHKGFSYAAWKPMSPTPYPGIITEGRIYLHRAWAFGHELGHVLGLTHRFLDIASCMSYSQWPWPDVHDLESVAEVYKT
jgi:hypothetical protein